MISLVVVNYNAGEFLKESVRTGLEQADQVVVVDNASTDDSIDRLQSNFPNEPRLKVVRNATNLGFAAGCNIGTANAAGDTILFLNPDCRLEPGAVLQMMSVLQSDSAIGMAGGLLVNPDGTEQGGGRRAVPTPWRSFVRAVGLHRFSHRWPQLFFDFHLHKQPLPSAPIEVEAISGACMLVKRAVMEDVGLWDEGYFLHCEDLDWCMRFRQKGWKVMFVPSAKIIHAQGISSRSRPVFVEWHKHRGMMRFYRKFFSREYPGALMWLVTAGVWLRFGIIAGYHLARQTLRKLGTGRG